MTQIRTRARVGSDGNITIPVGVAEAGAEVEVIVTRSQPKLSPEEYRAIIERTAGSIDDPTFVRPPQWDVREREPLD
jgi:hypothetical protein